VKAIVIAIDGPAGAGKSTLARGVARVLRLTYVDTGAMYRAVAWKALQMGVHLNDPAALTRLARRLDIRFTPSRKGQKVFADGVDVTRAIRSPEAAQGASCVAVIPGVRRAMVRRQRSFGKGGGVVMEGRDIGTVVFPRADVKYFLTASVDERAHRRFAETRTSGANLKSVADSVRRRDRRDRSRKDSPLRPAKDAILFNNTGLTKEQSLEKVIDFLTQRGMRP